MLEDNKHQIIELYSVQNKSMTYISEFLGISTHFVRKVLVENSIKIRDNNFYKSKYVDETFFDEIDTEEKAYILGFLYADGCVSKNVLEIKLSIKDYSLLENIKNALHSEHKIITGIISSGYGKGNQFCFLSINNKHLAESLIKAGVFRNKTKILKFPTYDIVPESLINHFIRGYFDGDGSVYKTNSGLSFSFDGTKEFLSSLLNIIREITGTRATIYKYSKIDHYYLTIGGNRQTKLFYDYLYKDAAIFLGRKKIVFEQNLL